jgi:hypothetical protein
MPSWIKDKTTLESYEQLVQFGTIEGCSVQFHTNDKSLISGHNSLSPQLSVDLASIIYLYISKGSALRKQDGSVLIRWYRNLVYKYYFVRLCIGIFTRLAA